MSINLMLSQINKGLLLRIWKKPQKKQFVADEDAGIIFRSLMQTHKTVTTKQRINNVQRIN